MKNLIILVILFLITQISFSGTCSSISRTNYTSGQVLTSSSLNTQLNTAYTFLNAYDGGCIAAGSLESDALDSTSFAAVTKGIQQGCSVSYSTANNLIISKCLASVNGNLINKTTTTTVSMGCTNCSSDSSSTAYYLYIATGSSGSTITGLILTTAPNADGYDNSGNKVLARFYNNASSDIDQYSIDQWVVNKFVPTNVRAVSFTPSSSWVSNTTVTGFFAREGGNMRAQFKAALSSAPTSASLTFDIPTGYLIDSAKLLSSGSVQRLGQGSCYDASGAGDIYPCHAFYLDTNTVSIRTDNSSGGTYSLLKAVTQAVPVTFASGDEVSIEILVPIVGWND